ncbi:MULTISPECIES: hypothetical protein [Chitinophaga]|nr:MULTISPECIES: hypothetical protein [Chitinophaga]
MLLRQPLYAWFPLNLLSAGIGAFMKMRVMTPVPGACIGLRYQS